MYNNITFN